MAHRFEIRPLLITGANMQTYRVWDKEARKTVFTSSNHMEAVLEMGRREVEATEGPVEVTYLGQGEDNETDYAYAFSR